MADEYAALREAERRERIEREREAASINGTSSWTDDIHDDTDDYGEFS